MLPTVHAHFCHVSPSAGYYRPSPVAVTLQCSVNYNKMYACLCLQLSCKTDVNSKASMPLNRCYVLKKHQSSTVTIPQQDDVGRIQRAVTTTDLDLEALEEIDYSDLDNSVAVTSDSF